MQDGDCWAAADRCGVERDRERESRPGDATPHAHLGGVDATF
jgi:hypothetical protein